MVCSETQLKFIIAVLTEVLQNNKVTLGILRIRRSVAILFITLSILSFNFYFILSCVFVCLLAFETGLTTAAQASLRVVAVFPLQPLWHKTYFFLCCCCRWVPSLWERTAASQFSLTERFYRLDSQPEAIEMTSYPKHIGVSKSRKNKG